MRRVLASSQPAPQAGRRDRAETLLMLTQAANLVGFKRATMVCKDYVYAHRQKAPP